MKGKLVLWGVWLIAISMSLVQAEYLPLRVDLTGECPQTQILASEAQQVQFEVKIPGVYLLDGIIDGKRWDRVEIPGGGFELDLGAPETPHFTRFLAIPARAGVRAEFEALETRSLSGIELMPAQGVDPGEELDGSTLIRFKRNVYTKNDYYPSERVQVSDPLLVRGLRLVSVRLNPIQYNPVTKELLITTRCRITVHFEGTDLRNVPEREIPISRSWGKLMASQVLNYDELLLDEQDMGSYMVVCENDANLTSTILPPLVDWKKRKGHSVTVQTFSPGASNTTIKNLIQTAYNTWPVPPEYVLLFGDTDGSYALPGWSVYGAITDWGYELLEGNDILPDVAVGRLPAGDATEANTMINKVLFYEKMPYTTNSDWFHQGVLIAGNSYSGISTIQVNRWIKTRMVERQYTRIDTFWYGMAGSVAGTLTPAINNGVLYANYRGCYLMENFNNGSIDQLTNNRKLPFVVTITCGTGGFSVGSESLMEHFMAVGTPTVPKGAIAAIGTATILTHTRQNNTITYGVFAGIFDEGLTQAGNALNRGKLELWNTYGVHDWTSANDFSQYAALAGDPGLELFTQAIQYLTCDVPNTVTLGDNSLDLTVTEMGVGPLEGATVCLYLPGTGGFQVMGLTDENGQIQLPLSPTTAGNVKVTITKQNFYPQVDSLDLIQADVAVGYFNHTVDDDNQGGSSGDNDGVINPGEVVQIPTVMKNYGNLTTATGLSVAATENSPYATLSNATQSLPNLAPGATGSTTGSFIVTVAPNCPHGEIVRLNLNTTSNQGSWDGLIDLNVVSYSILINSAIATGNDTLLSPGETTDFVLSIRNLGGKTASSLTASLTSLDTYVSVNENSASFGTVNPNTTASCGTDPFNLTAAQNAPSGHQADLVVTFSANGATQTDTLTITLGVKSSADPMGPDEYGYYCFDNTDINYDQHPTYNWVEIDPSQGGSGGTQLGIYDPYENYDASINLLLPFTFRYYGVDVNTITVCTNGWISMIPNVSFTDFRNYPIPSPIGPYGMVAPLWDDLITWSGGYVFAKTDTANHRAIIEWSRMKNLGSSLQQVVEVILYDPAYYPTPTGDGEILFQYFSITPNFGPGDDNPWNTVGIESPDQQTGLEVCYWNSYDDPAAAPLQAGRAYLFTTDFSYSPPGSNLSVTLAPQGLPIVIPPSGGSFNYDITVANNSPLPSSASSWCNVTLPSGSIYGPTLGPILLSLPGNVTLSRLRTQNVPANAPAGDYVYHAYIGQYPGTIYDQDSFPFSKSAVGDEGNGINNWNNTGESFDDYLVTNNQTVPQHYALRQAYPNPFNPVTTLSFDLPQSAHVQLLVYDITGRVVAQLANGWYPAGNHQAVFEASHLTSGLYLIHFAAGNYQQTQKLVLLK